MVVMSKLGLTPARVRRQLEAELRRAEVAREFEELQQRYQDEIDSDTDNDPVYERALYAPPWRDRLHKPTDIDLETGRYSPFYGPANENQFAAEKRHYYEGIEGGGLWDHSESRGRPPKHSTRRIDHEQVLQYARKNYLTPAELRILYLFWVDMRSYSYIANQLRISKRTVQVHIQNIRYRVKAI